MTTPAVEERPASPAGARADRRLVVLVIGGVAVLGVLIAVFGAPLVLIHRQDLPLEQQYGHFAVSMAARLEAGNATNPLANNARTLATGRDAYTGSCAECHGAVGDGKGALGQSTYPPATDLTTHDVQEKSDADLFWITKNGLSFTGMPGFGDQYTDQDIWALVIYIRSLQSGQASPVSVPTPTAQQLAAADPSGSAVQRGAAVYFAQGCQQCHGPIGNAPANLALRGSGEVGAIRQGRPGMPAYGTNQISDSQLSDLEAYMQTLAGQQQGVAPGQFQPLPPAAGNGG
jgi:mono/diheme cytochrome c family protein